MRTLKTLSLVACLIVAASSFAQDHPNEDHGFKPDKMYSFTELDHINTFNGNLVVTLPMGQKFQVSPQLSYSYSAVYNSNIWDYFFYGDDHSDTQIGPSTRSNAGAGWSISLGRLLSGKDETSHLPHPREFLFISPDGAEHPLYFQLPIPADPKDYTWKSYDSTYIFMTGETQDPIVYMPDGTKYFFSDTGDRIHYRLSAIFDRFGNWVNIQYPETPGYAEVWKVEDSQGRKQTLYFKNAIGTSFPQKLLDRIEFQTFGGGTATWQLNYAYRYIQRNPNDTTAGLIKVAFLREIVQPDSVGTANGPRFSFTKPGSSGLDPDPSYSTSGNATGRIYAMQLPTKGWIEWDLDDLKFPVDPDGEVDLGPNNIVGVQARRQLDANRNPLGEWKYFHRWGCGGVQCQTPKHWIPCHPDAPRQLVAMVQQPDATTVVRYYHLMYHPTCWDSPTEDWNNNEYALPLTSYTKDPEERRLSWELRTGVNPDDPSVYNKGSIGTGTVLRTYFTHYQQIYALGGDVTQTNRREQSSRTVFNDDQNCGSSGTETCYKTISKFDFIDAFGLYRQESEGGNFPNAKYRTNFTNYDGTLNTAKDWILGTYTEQCAVDEDTSRLPSRVWDWSKVVPVSKCSDLGANALTAKVKFDRSTGVIEAKRTLVGSALSKTDLLTTLTRDSKGNVTFERFYGGDTSDQELSESESAMFTPPSSPKYEIGSTYTYDGTTLVKRQAKYTGASFFAVDEDYDKWTGVVKATRDAAGVETTYFYDTLGRMQTVNEQTANGKTETIYIFTDASASSNAAVSEIKTVGGLTGTVLSSGTYEYDGIGRVKRTSRLLANGKVSVVQVDYDGMGRKAAESQATEYATHPFGTSITGYWTRYSYDPFNRPSSITQPDGGGASMTYLGAREMTRTNWVASSAGGGSSLATTKETYDAHGRLRAVEEESGNTSVDKPKGDLSTTSYTYDLRGNLTGVSMGTQTRTFSYDGRGFLTRETGPEAGDTVYSNFDAKGHALQREQGGHTLTYVYDSAERLTHVKDEAGEDIKFFDFAKANDGANKKNGKLITAKRRNELQSAGVIDVTESYEYRFPNGQMSKRSTLVEKVETGGARTTLQQFDYNIDSYDDWGQPKNVRMPTCTSVACEGGGIASVTNTRKAGFLTSVDGFGQLTYHANGMTKTVQHATQAQATDQYDALLDMPRPSRITFQGCTNTKPYFLPGFVTPKVNPTACGIDLTWPAATLCGGVSNIKYRVYRNEIDITGPTCLTDTHFTDTTAVKGQTYTYKIVAEGPTVPNGIGFCQRGQTTDLAGKAFEYKSCAAETILTVEKVRASVGVDARFQATLTTPNGPLRDEILTFSVNNTVIGTATTGSTGLAILEHKLDIEPKDYPGGILVTYAGGLYPKKEARADLTVVCDGPSYHVIPGSYNVLAVGGSFPVLVVTSTRCTWTPIPSSTAFFTIDPTGQRSGIGTFNINVPNAGNLQGQRASHVKVVDKNVIVEQSSACTYRFSPTPIYVPFKSPFPVQMQVTAPPDCYWNLETDADWIDFNIREGTGDGVVLFQFHENFGKQRTAEIRLNGGVETATVNQYAPPPVQCPIRVDDLQGPGTVSNGQFISLRAYIEGTYLEYEWWINGRPTGVCREDACQSKNLEQHHSDYPPPGQTYRYQLVASNSCDTVVTREVTVTNTGFGSCNVPIITESLFRDFAPFDQHSPMPGWEVQLWVVGINTGPGTMTYQWYEGFAGDTRHKVADELGGKTDTIRVRPFGTTFYWVAVSNDCGTNISRTGGVFFTPRPRVRRRAVGKDFSGDFQNDLLWHNPTTGQNEVQAMNGVTPSAITIPLPTSSPALQLQSIGDFDDNERPDLVFRNPQTGQNEVWMMSAWHLLGSSPLETRTDGRWSIGGVADLDNDYNDDVIWHNDVTGENEIWFQTGTERAGTWKLPSNPGPGWGLHGTDFFNNDESPDLFFHNRITGENSIWYMNDAEPGPSVGTAADGSTSSSSPVRRFKATIEPMASMPDTNWMPAMVADYNGDGYADIVWRNGVTGENKIWTMTGATVKSTVDLPARDTSWQIGGGGSTNAGGGTGTDPRTATTLAVVATPAQFGTASAVTATLTAGSTALAGKQVAFSLNGNEVVRLLTDSTGSVTAAVSVAGIAAGTYPDAITVKFDGDNAYAASTSSTSLVINAAPAEVAWSNPAPIVYGTPLSAAQLNATATAPGTFVYNPPAGTILNAGYNTLAVTFTPTDTTLAPVTKNAVILVEKAPSSVAWAKPASIVYGTPLSDIQLNATSSLAGEFTYDPRPGSVLAVGNGQVLRVTFEPESPNYSSSTGSTTIDVSKGSQSIRWSAPAPITYPTPLGDAQLNAEVIASGLDPAGALTYTPPAGTVLAEGVHELKVTAAETASYLAASLTVDIVVNRKTATLSWTSPDPITYGTPLSATQLNATATVAGTFVYTPAAGTVLDAGTHYLTVNFTPTEAGVEAVSQTVTIRVLKVQPVVTYAQPAPIVYGTPLSSAQLNATSNVAGSFTYNPPAGTILDAGTHEILASFIPTDTRNYESAAATVTLTVNKAPQTINWSSPAAIVYGTALSATQLNATVSVVGPAPAGALTYTPPAGTVLQAGAAQVLTVTAAATPNYEQAAKSVAIDVLKATPVLTWPQPAPIVYKTLLSSTQLNATADVPGTFVYTPASGTLLQAGTHTLSTQFAPTDTHNYNNAAAEVTLEVQRANPVLGWTRPAGIVYGTPLGATQLNATADVPGTFTYTPAAGTILDAGDGQTLSVHFRPEDTRNYNDAETSTTIDVAKAKQTIVWPAPSPIVYGTPLSATQLNASVEVVGPSPAGALTYTPPAGTVLDAGTRTLTVDAAETHNYEPATATVTLQVNRAPLSLTVDAKSKLYGDPVPALTGVLTGVQNNDAITPSYATTATQASPTGVYAITATLLDPNDRLVNYDVTITPSTLTVNPAPLLIAANAVTKQYSDPVPVLTATYTGFVLGETPAVLSGVLLIQTTAERLSPPGVYPITIGGLSSTNYVISYLGATLTELPEDARVQVVSPLLFSVAPTGPTTITLVATIRDISATADANGDVDSGDIRTATLTFVDRATDTVLCTAPIGLTVATDERTGLAMCTFTRDFGTLLPATIVVGSRVGAHYTRDAAADDVTLTIAAPGRDFVTAAGALSIASPSGPEAPDVGSTARLEFNLRYDNKGLVQGRMVLNFTRTVNGAKRDYELAPASIASMAIKRTTDGGIAAIVGTGTLRDVTSKSKPIVIAEGVPMVVTATDGGQPAANDALSFTLYKPTGGLWMATGWDGIRAVETPLEQGAVGVHPGN